MFTKTHCHGASFNALRTPFRRAAEAQARQQGATAPAENGALSSSRVAWPRHQGRLTAAVASVLVSIGLLGSVVIGLTSMASPADMSVATTSAPVTELMARQQVRSPLGPTA